MRPDHNEFCQSNNNSIIKRVISSRSFLDRKTTAMLLTMLILNLIILNMYQYLHIAESFKIPTIDQPNTKLSTRMQNILCSTDSISIRLLLIDDGMFDEIDDFVTRLNKECPFKTIQLGGININPTKSIQEPLLHHSEVIVFMVYARESIPDFGHAVATYHAYQSHGSNSYRRFVVVFRFKYELGMLRNIFIKFARKSTFNIVVLMHEDYVEEIIVEYNSLDEMFHVIDGASAEHQRKDLFMRSLSDLRDRKLIVSMHEQIDRAILKKNGIPGYTGVDGLVADLLEERMNLTFQYTTPHEMYNGNKNSGVIGDLTVGSAEMSFNADSLALALVNDAVDVTEPFERNDMCILVPKAGNEPIIWNLLRTLSKWTWVITLISMVVMMSIYWWAQSIQKLIFFRKYPYYEYSKSDIATIIYQSFFGDAIRRTPTSMPLRILIIGWCVYSFLITNAFQAKLISSLVLPKGLSDIETIEGLGHSNLAIMYPKALAHLIEEYTDNRTMNMLTDQLVEVESWNQFDSYINNKSSSSAFIMMRFQADLMENRNFDKATGRPFYKTMKQCFLTFPRVYFLKLGSVYVDYVSDLLRRFHETGFIVKWTRHSEFTNALHGNVPVDEIDEGDVDEADIKVVITTEHLQTSFFLLLFGLITASLAFVAENIYFRRNRSE